MSQNQWPYRGWRSYIVAIVIVLAGFAIRDIFLHPLGVSVPYVTFYPTVMFAALYGGFSAGIVATLLSAFFVLFRILGVSQVSHLSQADWIGAIVFISSCLISSYICEMMHRAQSNNKDKTCQLIDVNEELTRQRQIYQTLLENLPDMVTRLDKELRHIYVNPALEKMSDRKVSEVIGKTWKELGNQPEMYEPLIARINTVFETKQCMEYQFEYSSQDGIKYYFNTVVPEFENAGIVNTVLIVTRDITLQKNLDIEISRLDRLNVIGEMAASIGHEIRNPLTTVRGYLQWFGAKGDFADHKEQFEMMIEELDRANFIITEFLSLSKDKAVAFERTNLNDNIGVLFPLLQADAFCSGHNMELELSDIPDNDIDKKEIRQLLMNLSRNGLEAMPTGGTVTIKTYLTNGQIILAVQDTGNGIPQQIMDNLGTPFITTKENGTGLGLAVCYKIADRHNAKIEVETGSNGTTFFIKFTEPARVKKITGLKHDSLVLDQLI